MQQISLDWCFPRVTSLLTLQNDRGENREQTATESASSTRQARKRSLLNGWHAPQSREHPPLKSSGRVSSNGAFNNRRSFKRPVANSLNTLAVVNRKAGCPNGCLATGCPGLLAAPCLALSCLALPPFLWMPCLLMRYSQPHPPHCSPLPRP
jgi:hypothetical protein